MRPLVVFSEFNRAVAQHFDVLFPARRPATEAFLARLDRALLEATIALDIGGGRSSAIPLEHPARMRTEVWGLDVDGGELSAAEPGSYQRAIVADACRMDGVAAGTIDVAFSHAVLEHVAEPHRVFAECYRVLRSGGVTVHLIPGGWSPSGIVNRLLPQTASSNLLRLLHGGQLRCCKFPAYYRCSTPKTAEAMMREAGFVDVEVSPHYHANYMETLFPAHVLEVAYQIALQKVNVGALCDAFVVSGRKR